jgi:hypothetical protein
VSALTCEGRPTIDECFENTDVAQNYHRKAEALLRLGRVGEALKAIKEGSAIDNDLFRDVLEQAKRQLRVESHYKKYVDVMSKVAVRVEHKTGKGLYANRDIKEEEEILIESPSFYCQKTQNKVNYIL